MVGDVPELHRHHGRAVGIGRACRTRSLGCGGLELNSDLHAVVVSQTALA
jgi:hypothetical protein